MKYAIIQIKNPVDRLNAPYTISIADIDVGDDYEYLERTAEYSSLEEAWDDLDRINNTIYSLTCNDLCKPDYYIVELEDYYKIISREIKDYNWDDHECECGDSRVCDGSCPSCLAYMRECDERSIIEISIKRDDN